MTRKDMGMAQHRTDGWFAIYLGVVVLGLIWGTSAAMARVAVIGINLDWDLESARAVAVENHMDWPNAHPSGAWQDDEIPAEYGTHILDQVWIIGRDGRLIERGLREPEEIRRALDATVNGARGGK